MIIKYTSSDKDTELEINKEKSEKDENYILIIPKSLNLQFSLFSDINIKKSNKEIFGYNTQIKQSDIVSDHKNTISFNFININENRELNMNEYYFKTINTDKNIFVNDKFSSMQSFISNIQENEVDTIAQNCLENVKIFILYYSLFCIN